jgi:hypothetical protein
MPRLPWPQASVFYSVRAGADRLFESITTPLKIEIRDSANYLTVAVAVGLSAMVAFMFGAVAVYIATRNAYGAFYGCLAEVGYCIIVGAAAVGVILLSRNKARRRAVVRAQEEEIQRRRKNAGAPPAWKDMGVITTALPFALKVARIGLRNKAMLWLVAGGIAAGWSAWQATQARSEA